MPTTVGSGTLLGQKTKEKFSVDLKLGRLGDLGDGSTDKFKDTKSLRVSSPSGSSRRARALNGTQNVSCLVDGCTSDLRNCREYHRRHRVCERHSKTPVVIIGGQEKRFCQQCSRFHSLGEFDEVKRSCRKRLDGHNRRRRKTQPESFYLGSGNFLSNHQGTGFLQFGSSQMLTTSTASSPTWPRIARSEEEAMFYNHCQQLHVGPIPFPNSMYNRGGDKEFPFLQDNDPKISHLVVAPEVPNFHPVRVQAKNGRASHELTRPASSDCAFSLLSLPATQFSGISLAQLLHTNATPPVQTISSGPHWFNNLAQHSCSQVIESVPISPVLVPVDTTKANDHCNTMFHMGSSGLSENEPS